ncbi:MAG TPA: hypothetical protein VEK07_03865 [Polyangiaceae bacterium]|nr:hypothetical protein [Polyangiaceae bacterium]
MNRRFAPPLLVAMAFVAVGCAESIPVTNTAVQVESLQCDPASSGERDVAPLASRVLGVEPLYTHIMTGNNNAEDRVCGAKILVRPLPNESAEALTRALQCHSARVLLGRIDASRLPVDPFSLANSWLDIDVKAEDGNFAIELQADTVSKNLEILARANAFGSAHAKAL